MLKRDETCDRTAKIYLAGMRNVPTYRIQRGEECRCVHQKAANWGLLQLGDSAYKDATYLQMDRCKQHRCENLKYRTDLPTFPRTTPVIYTASGSRNN